MPLNKKLSRRLAGLLFYQLIQVNSLAANYFIQGFRAQVFA
jgi:hypothetical protein